MVVPSERAGLQYRPYLSATASVVAAVAQTAAAAYVAAAAYTAIYWPSVAAQMPSLLFSLLL